MRNPSVIACGDASPLSQGGQGTGVTDSHVASLLGMTRYILFLSKLHLKAPGEQGVHLKGGQVAHGALQVRHVQDELAGPRPPSTRAR